MTEPINQHLRNEDGIVVNKRAKTQVEKEYIQEKESREFSKRIKYRRTYVGGKQKILHVTPLMQMDWFGRFWLHDFAGKKPLSFPVFCANRQFKGKSCDLCGQEGTWGETYPTLYRVGLFFVHDFYKRKWKAKDGKTYMMNPIRVFCMPAGRDSTNWSFMDEEDKEGTFQKGVIQIRKLKKGMDLRKLKKSQRLKLSTEGRVPKEILDEVGEFDEDTFWGHMLNCFKSPEENQAHDYFDVQIIDVSPDDLDEAIDSDDDEDEDEDEDTGAEEDEEEDDNGKSKKQKNKKKVSSKSAKKSKSDDESEEDDDDDDDEDDSDGYDLDEEDEDDGKVSKKKSSKSEKSNKSKTKSDSGKRLRR